MAAHDISGALNRRCHFDARAPHRGENRRSLGIIGVLRPLPSKGGTFVRPRRDFQDRRTAATFQLPIFTTGARAHCVEEIVPLWVGRAFKGPGRAGEDSGGESLRDLFSC